MDKKFLNQNENDLNVAQDLKRLKKIEAPQNFEVQLLRKINQEKFKAEDNFLKRFWKSIPLIPSSIGVAAASLILFFFLINKKTDFEKDVLSEFNDENKFLVIYFPEEEKIIEAEKTFSKSILKKKDQDKKRVEEPDIIMQDAFQIKTETAVSKNKVENRAIEKENNLSDSIVKSSTEYLRSSKPDTKLYKVDGAKVKKKKTN